MCSETSNWNCGSEEGNILFISARHGWIVSWAGIWVGFWLKQGIWGGESNGRYSWRWIWVREHWTWRSGVKRGATTNFAADAARQSRRFAEGGDHWWWGLCRLDSMGGRRGATDAEPLGDSYCSWRVRATATSAGGGRWFGWLCRGTHHEEPQGGHTVGRNLSEDQNWPASGQRDGATVVVRSGTISRCIRLEQRGTWMLRCWRTSNRHTRVPTL